MQHDDRYLDNAIDRTVRDMLDIDPPPGLRQRVLAEIEGSDTLRAWTWPRLAIVTALGAAAVVLAIATLFRPAAHEVLRIATTQVEPAPRPPVTSAPPAAAAAATGPQRNPDLVRAQPQPPPHHAAAPDRPVEAANVTMQDEITIAPLTDVDPIRFAPVGAPALVVTEIGIDAIQVAPLRLDPLSSTPH